MSDVTQPGFDARQRALLESLPDAIVVVGAHGRIVFMNGQAHTMFGFSANEIVGQPIEVLLPERFRRGHVGHRDGYLAQPRVRPMGAGLELFALRKDGTEFPVEISLSPVQGDSAGLVVSAIRDSTERRRFERTLQEKNAELERANQAKDRFLATMSHELRTPLNAIIGFAGTLLMQLPGTINAEQEKQLRTVQSNARHLLSLINDLLDLAKIESGKVELRLEPVVCQDVLGEVAAALQLAADKKGLQLVVSAPEWPVIVHSDRRALQQIVLNLGYNAVKFTDHGSVSLAVLRLEPPNSEAGVEISVTDTGVGISAEDQGRLFHAFAQVGGSSRRREGTGLGLHLSRKLAELLGATLTVASEPGRGSRFAIVLREK